MQDSENILGPREGAALSALQLLFIVCDRFSHAMRTHLGVALGIIEDAANGYELSLEDYGDGKNALKAVLAVLESVRDMTNLPEFSPRRIDLGEYLRRELTRLPGLLPEHRLCREIPSFTCSCLVDEKLFSRGLRNIFQYISARKHRFPLPEDGQVRFVLDFPEDAGETMECPRARLKFSFRYSAIAEDNFMRSIRTFRELAERDHSPESLGLILADEVCKLHGGWTELESREAGSMELRVYLP